MRLASLPRRAAAILALMGIFAYDLVVASLAVARTVLSRNPRIAPAIVEIPVDLRTELGVASFANFVSLTPGSTCLHVSEDRRTLYVHLLDAPDQKRAAAEFKDMYETWIRRAEG
jgi:multicomponent Na+:H+ antiporter subunit E